MKKEWKRLLSVVLSAVIVLSSAYTVTAADTTGDGDNFQSEENDGMVQAPLAGETDNSSQGTDASGTGDPKQSDVSGPGADSDDSAGADQSSSGTPDNSGGFDAGVNSGSSDSGGFDTNNGESSDTKENAGISGKVTVDNPDDSGTKESADISGKVTVEADEHDDNVKIRKNDKPYLALGADLSPEQQATVLALMGIDAGRLNEYNVMYVNNTEEHQYLDSYIDKSKIGTRSLSSIVIVERGEGNGINISTNNISYCTVGMYKNALATAGIQNADIIVAAPSAISGTAALVGIFKAYREMTGDEIDEESIDTSLHELVLTGDLESASGADPDEVEAMIAYVKQAVVEHDMSDETEIRKAISEGCEKFSVTLSESEITRIVQLMQKINELDLDIDELLNSAQSIYDKIAKGEDVSGFFSKLGGWFSRIIDALKKIFS